MKKIIGLIIIVAMLAGCSSVRPVSPPSKVHEQTIGAVQIAYDNGDWIKIVSTGTAPLHGKSAHAVSEASKIAAMHAKANIAEFMNINVRSDKIVNTISHSNINTKADDGEDGDMNVLSEVIEHLRTNSNAVLRGTQVTNQSYTDDYATVEITVTKQSVTAAQSVQSFMNGTAK